MFWKRCCKVTFLSRFALGKSSYDVQLLSSNITLVNYKTALSPLKRVRCLAVSARVSDKTHQYHQIFRDETQEIAQIKCGEN